MTMLSPNVPTLHEEDSFRLLYLGTYGAVRYDEDLRKIVLDTVEAPLPKGKFLWDGEDYLGGMEKGEAKYVPFHVIRIYWGDPRSVPSQFGRTESRKGQIGDIAPREQELRRLGVLYGIYDTNMDLIGKAVPDVEITTASDVKVFCPAVDPDGSHIYGYSKDSAAVHDPATRFAQLESEMRMVMAQLEAQKEKGVINDGADVAVDEPPAKRARG